MAYQQCDQFRTSSKKLDCTGLFVVFTVKAVLFQIKQLLDCFFAETLMTDIIADVAGQYGLKP